MLHAPEFNFPNKLTGFDAQGGSIEWKLLAVSPKVLQWITALTFPLHTPFLCQREPGVYSRHILFEETGKKI